MSNFAERASEITQRALIGIAMSLASEVGIFQVLANADSPLTSYQVAMVGGLKERSKVPHTINTQYIISFLVSKIVELNTHLSSKRVACNKLQSIFCFCTFKTCLFSLTIVFSFGNILSEIFTIGVGRKF